MLLEELHHQIELIHASSNDKRTPWNERTEALQQLVSLCDEFNDTTSFASALPTLYECFVVQLQDLRSKVIMLTCELIQALAERLQSDFEESAEFLFPHLQKHLANKKKTFYEPANTTIQTILVQTQSPRVFCLLLEATKNKSPAIRSHAYENIIYCAKSSLHAIKHLTELKTEIFTSLSTGFGDVSPDVRTKCATLYWIIHKKYPDECEVLYNALPSAKQDRILQSRKQSENQQPGDNIPQTIPTKQIRIPIRQHIAQQARHEEIEEEMEIVVKKPTKPMKSWIASKLQDLWNSGNWKQREELLLDVEMQCDEYSDSMELKDWREVAALISIFLFSEGHYKVIERAIDTFGVLLRGCTNLENFSSVLTHRNPASCLKDSHIQQMESYGVTMAQSYGILGALCYISRTGGTETSRSECRILLNFLANSIPPETLFECCITLIRKVQKKNEIIEEEFASIVTGALALMGELVSGNPYFEEEHAYAEISYLLMGLMKRTKSKGIVLFIKRLFQAIYANDCLQFSIQVNQEEKEEGDAEDEGLILEEVNEILHPEVLFSDDACRRFKQYGKERAEPDLLGNIGWKGSYTLEDIQNILKSDEVQHGNMEILDFTVLDAALCSMIYLCRFERGAQWFTVFPCLFELFHNALAEINKSSYFHCCNCTKLVLRLLIGFQQLVALLPHAFTTKLIDAKLLGRTRKTLQQIKERKFIPNCAELALVFLQFLSKIAPK